MVANSVLEGYVTFLWEKKIPIIGFFVILVVADLFVSGVLQS